MNSFETVESSIRLVLHMNQEVSLSTLGIWFTNLANTQQMEYLDIFVACKDTTCLHPGPSVWTPVILFGASSAFFPSSWMSLPPLCWFQPLPLIWCNSFFSVNCNFWIFVHVAMWCAQNVLSMEMLLVHVNTVIDHRIYSEELVASSLFISEGSACVWTQLDI